METIHGFCASNHASAIWADGNAVWVRFTDNPNGADTYELEILFGR